MSKKGTLQLETLACPTCMQKIEGAIRSVDGVDQGSVKVLFNASKAKFEFDDGATSVDAVADAVRGIGYDVLKASAR
ncbi:MAG: heavy-metal-associated domain-containing protein [Olsenella sp.]